jgi:hypothetical protein
MLHRLEHPPRQPSQIMEDPIQSFIQKARTDADVQHKLKLATTAKDLESIAAEAGITLAAPELIRHFARLLLNADDAQAVRHFDSLGWDAGELLWALKNWDTRGEANDPAASD